MRKIKLGIIGVGRIGKVHIQNLAYRFNDVEIVAVSDVLEQELHQVADNFNIANRFTDYHEIIQHSDIDAIVVCSPTDTHYDILMAAAEAGKHVFCEKPIELSLEKISQMRKQIQESRIKLMVGFNRRFDPNFKKVHDLVESGKIGEPQVLRITSRDPAPPGEEYLRKSGGLFLDMTIHDFDMARYLMRKEVIEVYAHANVLVDDVFAKVGDWDTAIVMLKFADGSMGAIDNSRQAVYGYDQRVEVFGSKGMVTVKNNTPDNHILIDEQGTHSALPLNFFMQRYTESYFNEMRIFVDCLINDLQPPVSVDDGYEAVAIGLAAMKSVKENRPVEMREVIS